MMISAAETAFIQNVSYAIVLLPLLVCDLKAEQQTAIANDVTSTPIICYTKGGRLYIGAAKKYNIYLHIKQSLYQEAVI
jgi:hypothetical protein